MPLCDDYLSPYMEVNREVSILVLVDAALRPKTPQCATRHVSVSILVLVDAALRRGTTRFPAWTDRVRGSILVLVDAALRLVGRV